MTGINTISQWQYMKKKLIEGLDCVLCGDPAQTLHHPHPSEYYEKLKADAYIIDLKKNQVYPPKDFENPYFNDETQIPMCHNCHLDRWHSFSEINDKTPVHEKVINGRIVNVKYQGFKGGGFNDDEITGKTFLDFLNDRMVKMGLSIKKKTEVD
jgi:hypothetical protein